MKRRKLIVLALVLGACAIGAAIFVYINERRSAQTYILATILESDTPSFAGRYVDITLTNRLPDGETPAELILSSIFVLNAQLDPAIGWYMTLNVTSTEAAILKQAKNRGTVWFYGCRRDTPKPMWERLLQLLQPRRREETGAIVIPEGAPQSTPAGGILPSVSRDF